jgi:Ca2+-transporting ATPase
VQNDFDETHTRTVDFTILITANIFLTLVNRSFYYSIFKTIRYKNNMVLIIIGITLLLTALLLYVPILSRFFEFDQLDLTQLGISIGIGFVSVIWIEFTKFWQRKKESKDLNK